MNFAKSKVLLKKINTIHDSAEAFDSKFSSLEKDLVLQYLRELYECLSDDQPTVGVTSPQPKVVKQVRQETISQPVPPPNVERPTLMPNIVAGQVGSNDQSKVLEALPVAVTPLSEQPREALSDDMADLFEGAEKIDRSQRFTNGPISDLGKAMGINERILTINELFKGDQKGFQDAIQQLNSFSSFDEAKDYMAKNMAKTHDWTAGKRVKKAKVFVKLVRRRYL